MQEPKKFALIGAAGYIAPRHLKAIHETGNQLVAAFDPRDSVGILDSFFPHADFFVEFEQFDHHINMLKFSETTPPLDYVSICSPNYLHDSHIQFALRNEADAICEKPLVLDPENIQSLAQLEEVSGHRIHTILQLRLHPAIIKLREEIRYSNRIHDVDLTYITSRGHWYHVSWKGDLKKSGGIATNIGVHFFDMLSYIFGPVQKVEVHHHSAARAAGYLCYEKANVRWYLSLERGDVPSSSEKATYRSITIDGREIEFSEGFTDLHTESYNNILDDRGFGIEDTRTAIETVAQIRTLPIVSGSERHPFLAKALSSEIG